MLSIDKSTLEDSLRAIKVLVVPIGENSLFDSHFQTISVMRDTSVSGLTKPSSWTKENNQGFKHFDWSEGNLLFDYLRYDRVPNGPGDLDEFQSSRRVLMIVGLINYPELGEDPALKIQQEMEYFTRRHPNVILRRLFLFNYPFQEGEMEKDPYKELITPQLAGKMADPNLLIVFPPDLACAGGSMVKVHLQVNVENAAATIISAFGDQMRICDNASKKNAIPDAHYQIPLSTFFDEIEEREAAQKSVTEQAQARSLSTSSIMKTAASASSRNNYRKKPAGRIRKWMGDLSMQTCSPRDALEHYSASVDVSRANEDHMWLAGALEGYAAAVLLAIKLGLPLEEVLSKDLKAVGSEGRSKGSAGAKECTHVVKALLVAQEKAAEAIRLYSRSVVFCGLEVECALRVAKMQEMIGVDVRRHRWYGREQRAWAYVLHALSVPGLNVQQQTECAIEGALVCKRLQLKRKYAFLLYVAALMCAESDNTSMAHALMRNACSQYGIAADPLPCVNNGASPFASSINPGQGGGRGSLGAGKPHLTPGGIDLSECAEVDIVVEEPNAAWDVIRAALLAHGARLARDAGDAVSSTRFASALLRLHMRQSARNMQSLLPMALSIAPPGEWHDQDAFLGKIRRARMPHQALRGGSHRLENSHNHAQGQGQGQSRAGADLPLARRIGPGESAAASNTPMSEAVSVSASASHDTSVHGHILRHGGAPSAAASPVKEGSQPPHTPAASSHGHSHSSATATTSFVAARSAQVAGELMTMSMGGSGSEHGHMTLLAASASASGQSQSAGAPSTSSAASTPTSKSSSFLSQIGLTSGPTSADESVRDSFSASMVAMLSQQQQQQASSYSSGASALGGVVGVGSSSALDFPSRSSGVEDLDLRCKFGLFSSDMHNFSHGAAIATHDQGRNVGLPDTLRNLGIYAAGGSSSGQGDRGDSWAGDEHAGGSGWGINNPAGVEATPSLSWARRSFSSILQAGSSSLVPPVQLSSSSPSPTPTPTLADSLAFGTGARAAVAAAPAEEAQAETETGTGSLPLHLLTGVVAKELCVAVGGRGTDRGRDVPFGLGAGSANGHADALGWMATQAEDLAPGYAVAAPELLVRVVPLHLPRGARPEEVEAVSVRGAREGLGLIQQRLQQLQVGVTASNDGDDRVDGDGGEGKSSRDGEGAREAGSSLFYNPFQPKGKGRGGGGGPADGSNRAQLTATAAKHAAAASTFGFAPDDEEVGGGGVQWAAHSLCKARALLYNPLAVAVRFTSVRLRLSGCAHRTISTSVIVPPYSSSYEIDLSAVPLEPGTLRVEGVELRINAAVWCMQVDKGGWARSALQENPRRHHYPRASAATSSSSASASTGLIRERWRAFTGGIANITCIAAAADAPADDRSADEIDIGLVKVVPAGPCALLQTHLRPAALSSLTGAGASAHAHAGAHAEVGHHCSTGTGTAAAALQLYRGESRTEWLRVVTRGPDDLSPGAGGAVADVRVTARWLSRVRVGASGAEGKGKAETYAFRERQEVLLDFSGALSACSATSRRQEQGRGKEQPFVALVGAGMASNDVSVSDLALAGAVQPLTLPLALPLTPQPPSEHHPGQSLCLQLQWSQCDDVEAAELSVEIVGASDPCVASVPELYSSSPSSSSSPLPSLEALSAAEERHKTFKEMGGAVRCRRGLLQVQVKSKPSLTAQLSSPLPIDARAGSSEGGGASSLRVLALDNHSFFPMLLSGAGECAEEEASTEQQQQEGEKEEEEEEEEWIRPSSVRLVLPARSSRNLLVTGAGACERFRWSIAGDGPLPREGVVTSEQAEPPSV